MPSTNGHGPRRAVLYARVSTDEQARSGYSLAQQIEVLRAYAAREAYEVLEEVSDPGQSGASLERPGMDRVRDLVAAGGVSVVLAQDRDRVSREPAYNYLLRQEFERHGCRLKSLNDRGDESPEGELTDGILDQLAKYERAKFAERTRRGRLRKAREGRSVSPIPRYGFRLNETRDGLVIHEEEMAVVASIFRMAAEGCGMKKMQSRLYAQGVPSPKGKPVWDTIVIRRIVRADEYRPLTHDEVSELVAPEVAAQLDPNLLYGVQWYNRHRVHVTHVSEPDGTGGKRYRERKTLEDRPREEWIAIPVPAYDQLSRGLVDLARSTMDATKGLERKFLAREWELRGLLRCSCGYLMKTHTTSPEGRGPYYYYTCHKRRERGRKDRCREPSLRFHKVEPLIWEFVSGMLRDPERIRTGMDRLIERERGAWRGDAEEEKKTWAEQIAEAARLRAAYQDQQAAGLMTLEELGAKLANLQEGRRRAEAELAALEEREGRVSTLERDRDALLRDWSDAVPEALESLSGEERNQIYRLLRLEVQVCEGGFEVSGALTSFMHIRNDDSSSTVSNEPLILRCSIIASAVEGPTPGSSSSSSASAVFRSTRSGVCASTLASSRDML
jgi:site-specific DNA recombinase